MVDTIGELKKYYEGNLNKYLSEHQGEYLLLNGSCQEQFFNTRSSLDKELANLDIGATWIIEKIPYEHPRLMKALKMMPLLILVSCAGLYYSNNERQKQMDLRNLEQTRFEQSIKASGIKLENIVSHKVISDLNSDGKDDYLILTGDKNNPKLYKIVFNK